MAAPRSVPRSGRKLILKLMRLRIVRSGRGVLPALAGVVLASLLLAAASVRSEQTARLVDNQPTDSTAALNANPPLTAMKQNSEPKKTNFQKTRDDAAKLSALADQLRDELNKMNANVFALDVIQKTDQLEKLAKKIKGEAIRR